MVYINHGVLGDVEIPENACNTQDILHAAAGYADFAFILCRNIDYLLQSVDIRRKGRNNNTLITVFKQHIEGLSDLALGCGMAGLFDIRRVAQKGKHALVTELAETGQVDHLALNGRYIDLEIAGVDNSAKRGLYRKCNSVGNAVVNIDELNAKAAEPEHIPCLLGEDLRIVKQIMLLKLELNKRSCERRCVDGYIKFGHNIRDSTDVILVTVGQDDTSDSVGIGLQV